MSKTILKKWRDRIERAKKRGYFTEYDEELSYNWAKCAVGERDCYCEKIIPKNPKIDVVPSWHVESEKNEQRYLTIENKLYSRVIKLGQEFHFNVLLNEFDKALETLKKIESLPKNKFYRKGV